MNNSFKEFVNRAINARVARTYMNSLLKDREYNAPFMGMLYASYCTHCNESEDDVYDIVRACNDPRYGTLQNMIDQFYSVYTRMIEHEDIVETINADVFCDIRTVKTDPEESTSLTFDIVKMIEDTPYEAFEWDCPYPCLDIVNTHKVKDKDSLIVLDSIARQASVIARDYLNKVQASYNACDTFNLVILEHIADYRGMCIIY